MNRKKLLPLIALVLVVALTGCAAIQGYFNKLTGSLFGKGYTITQYDDYGNLVFTVDGDKVTMDCETDEDGEVTSYIDITIDGDSWKHVGSTLVFAQKGVDLITDFQLPADMDSTGHSTGLMAVDRKINHYANLIGKDLVVLVSSQNGTPICLFQGDDCSIEIPADLPKTTLVHIDGKMVYVHRANVDIIPAE
ncbi:MAG: DUF5052 family protein, partial [Oscillospiraceae bacterium]|nr:DUF5052 family protein [Oscillospiraceae bacterium]